MNTKHARPQLEADPVDRIISEAVRADMERVYGVERRATPRQPVPPRELQPIFSRRQAE